ncbi:hypothetical protein D3C86_516790 [compost metagenome]
MLPGLPIAVLTAGAALAFFAGWRSRPSDAKPSLARLLLWLSPLWLWALGFALLLVGIGMEFRLQGMPDQAASAYAASLALLWGHAAGLGLLALSPGRPWASAVGLAMALGLPPFGAFAGLWLGLQAVQSAFLLLPAWPALALAAGTLAGLAGWFWAWQGGLQLVRADLPTRRGGLFRGLLLTLGVLGGFLPWLWVLPAQVVVAELTGELPMLLVALGMLLTPVIPGQASVIPFGILAIAMAVTSVLLLVLRLTRRPR